MNELASLLKTVPLTAGQQEIWLACQMSNAASCAYNQCRLLDLRGPLDSDVLGASLQALVDRHEALRTTFAATGETQEVHDQLQLDLDCVDLFGAAEAKIAGSLESAQLEEAAQPFDLVNGPLVRARLFRLEPEHHVLILTIHHIVCDGHSFNSLIRELAERYQEGPVESQSALPSPAQFSEYAEQQVRREQPESPDEEFWLKVFADGAPALQLPTDRPRPPAWEFEGACSFGMVPAPLVSRLKQASARQSCTLFTTLLATWAVLLERLTGQAEVVIGVPVAHRTQPGADSIVGHCTNLLPLRIAMRDETEFLAHLANVRTVFLDAHEHQHFAIGSVLQKLKVPRDAARVPLCSVTLNVERGIEKLDLGVLKVKVSANPHAFTNYDMSLNVLEADGALRLECRYNKCLFAPATVQRWLRHFRTLLEAIAADPLQKLGQLQVLTTDERQQIVVNWNDTGAEYLQDKCIHQWIEDQVQRTPGAIAAVFEDESVSYRELNARADQVARSLKNLGVGPEVRVGISAERSLDMLVGLVGILKAGGAYVPLDPSYPKDRLGFMLRDSGAPALLTQKALVAEMPFANAGLQTLCLDAALPDSGAPMGGEAVTSSNLAYVIYTSGSTGEPKGVALTHRNVAAFFSAMDRLLGAQPGVWLAVTSICFDISILELLWTLARGFTVVIQSDETRRPGRTLAENLGRHRVTHLQCTPSLAQRLILSPDSLGALRSLQRLLLGGEALPSSLAERLLQVVPSLLNMYGPTETTIWSAAHQVIGATPNIPIGRPLANTQMYVLDHRRQPVPIGVAGELFIGGEGVARGYLNRSQLTAERFVKDPFSGRPDARLYRTGDRARFQPDGVIEFLGRLDDQVKVRGFRVELGEIETALARHTNVRECVVNLTADGDGDKRLVAYVVPKKLPAPTREELRRFVRNRLPEYMVPSAFVPLPAIPLTSNGKVNRAALPTDACVSSAPGEGFLAPRDETEAQLAAIWEDLLSTRPIGALDDFFGLGGHSLLALRMLARIQKQMGKTVPAAAFFHSPTLGDLASLIRNGDGPRPRSDSSLMPVQPNGTRPPLFLVHGAGGGMIWGYANLARHLGPDQPVYAFRSRTLDGLEEFPSIAQMASQYVADLRAFQPHGPYYLGGYCFGGNVACEMAHTLREQGEEVALLALMNSVPPDSRYWDVRFSPRWVAQLVVNLGYVLHWHFHRTPAQRREFVSWKLQTLPGTLRRLFEGRKANYRDPAEVVDLSGCSPEERSVWNAHLQALFRHNTKPYSGRTVLLRSRGHQFWCSFDAAYGWRDYIRRGLDVRLVAGAHEQILEEPFAGSAGQELARALADIACKPELQAGKSQPQQSASPAAVVSPPQRTQVPLEWNQTHLEYPRSATLVQLFEAQAKQTPEATALVTSELRLSYRDLDDRAERLASRLRDLGVGPETLVGVCVRRSWRMVAGILAILKAGGAYVPMDPSYPKDRIAFMLADAQPAVLVTEQKLCSVFEGRDASPGALAIVCIDGDWDAFVGRRTGKAASPTNLAYVIYTSGSTGKPKGVAIEHRSPVALMYWAREVFSREEIAGVLAATSICFDLSVFETFLPLSWGGTMVLAENALALPSLPAAGEVTLINTVPSAIRELLRLKGIPASVRVVNLAGEPLTTDLADQIYRETSAQKVYDLYGPTETTTYSTAALRKPGDAPTIGRPLANEQVYLLDSDLHPAPIGVPAELYIGGEGLARGYLHRPELTAERFVPNPLKAGERLYKTGDLARWRADGNLEFAGRLDHQVKIRGFRLELGEIESVFRQHSEVAEAVVVVRERASGEKYLVAYAVSRSGQPLSSDDLRRFVSTKLPEQMIPADFVSLDKLPLTPNGKVDRNALPEVAPSRRSGRPLVAPRTPIETSLAAIWREVLEREQIGTHDNFFELGGHSLLATQVVSRMRAEFQTDVPLSSLFDSPTIAALAERLSAGTWAGNHPSLPLLEASPRNGFVPASFVQERLWLLDQLPPGGQSYHVPIAFRLRGSLDKNALERALDEIVRRHEALRTVFSMRHGELTQVIRPPSPLGLRMLDLCDQPASVREAEARKALRLEAVRPFDLERGPLVRGLLVQLGPADHVLGIVMHHAISDGWSLALFFRELGTLYTVYAAGLPAPELPALPVQCADFAIWQRRTISGEVLQAEAEWWKKALEGAPPSVQLPLDSEVSANQQGAARAFVRFPKEFSPALDALAQAQASTPFMICLTALAITLERWTHQDDLVLGTVAAGRSRRELEHVIGCFVNFLPLRIRMAARETGLEVLSRARTTVLDAQMHHNCPFQHIVEAVNPKRRADQNPLYNIALLLQNFPARLFQTPTLDAELLAIEPEAPLLDLRFEAEQTEPGFSLMCEYKTNLFSQQTIEHLLGSFQNVLETLVRHPETKVTDFPIAAGLVEQSKAARSAHPTDTIAVTATFTAEFLADPLRYWLSELELPVGVEFAPYGQVFQELLDPNSLLARNQRGLNVVLVRLEDWYGPGIRGATPSTVSARLSRSISEFAAALKTASARNGSTFLVCLCPPSKVVTAEPGLVRALQKVEDRLAQDLRPAPGVQVVTPDELFDLYPVAEYYDPHGEELGNVPYTPAFFAALATMIARRFHALHRAPCKVIALDCDQTLWTGICGEDGPSGVKLDPPRRELQLFMRHQLDAGRLLCLCSKNNEEDVAAVFERLEGMPLQPEHFVARRINWQSKSENLRALARELNLGLDSFVLVDDNPMECAEVAANCPETVTLHLPDDPSLIPQFLKHCWILDSTGATREDAGRTARYHQQRERENARRSFPSLAAFLSSLELKLDFRKLGSEDLPRISQLTFRTNQFNTTSRRRTEAELLRCQKEGCEILTLRVADRFGDYGLVGVVISKTEQASLRVETFLLSCRVLGKGVEHQVLAHLGGLAQEQGRPSVNVHFIPSAKNRPARDFLESVGGQFRQALNGGFVYSIPADVARSTRFCPAGAAEIPVSSSAAPEPPPDRRPGRYDRWRWIAMEANDPEKILSLAKASTPVRAHAGSYAEPRTELEKQLCEVWKDLLRLEHVGIHDDFFQVGGKSLLAVRLFARVGTLTGKRLPIVTIFQAPTIAQLAERLAGATPTQAGSPLIVPIHPQGTRVPLFLVHGAGGDAMWGYANLARHMRREQPIYGIQPRPDDDPDKFGTLEVMAADYVAELRAFRPEGPYCLGGYCFGGSLAYEMARQLKTQGQEVAFVGLLESAPEGGTYRQVFWWRPGFLFRFARNLWFCLADFRGYTPDERRSLLRRKMKVFARSLGKRIRGRRSTGAVDLDNIIDSSQFSAQEVKLWDAHLRLLSGHVSKPFPGHVTVFRTAAHPLLSSYENDLGWSALASGGVTVKLVAGAHANIFFEPNVRELARQLTDTLEEVKLAPPVSQKDTPL